MLAARPPIHAHGPQRLLYAYKHRSRISVKPASTAAVQAAAAQQSQMQPPVRTPLCDRCNYQYATLHNGLRVLLVQDPEAVFAAACANVQVGYFDDTLPGAAHFLEHMVHLGSTAFPQDSDYKAFLAAHGGSSNASTGMVHTRYHLKVHASALQGALERLGAALSQPLLLEECAAREVDNVHAEYSRNTNSDSRKLLQLKRSLGEPPYSGFSTGSIKTLWEEPRATGVSVVDTLRALWASHYTADSSTLAVVAPQETQQLLAMVERAFGSMRRSGSSGSGGGGCGSNGQGDGSSVCEGSRQQGVPHQAGGVDGQATAAAGATSSAARILDAPAVDCSSEGHSNPSSSSSSSSSSDAGDEGDVGDCGVPSPAAAAAAEGLLQGEMTHEMTHEVSAAGGAALAAGPQDGVSHLDLAHHQAHEGQVGLGQQQQQLGVWRYPPDVFLPSSAGRLVRVCPARDLRELQLVWYIPQGTMVHNSVKPWHLVAHLLGHEGPGSVAYLLKAQGLVQSLSVGVGDAVALGRGWMFWGVTLNLTQQGEGALEHVLGNLFRGLQVLQSCSDAQLHQQWTEVAALAALRFDWRDRADPLDAAQAAAHALHYHPPHQVLSGPVLMTSYDVTPVRWFLQQLTPHSMNIFWSSRAHQGEVDSREPYYGGRYTISPLPQHWMKAIEQYRAVDRQADGEGTTAAAAAARQVCQQGDSSQQLQPVPADSSAHVAEQQQQQQQQQQKAVVCGELPSPPLVAVPGELVLPPPNWALPSDLQLRQQQPPGDEAGMAQAAEGGGAAGPTADPTAGCAAAAAAAGPPVVVECRPGLCVWHQLDTSFGLPKVHLKLHIVTPLVYDSPTSSVTSRLLVAVLEDMLLPRTYPAHLAGTHLSLSSGRGGLTIKVTGFSGVAQQLLLEALAALRDLTSPQVSARFTTMKGRLIQSLTNWANNNPSQHSEYAAHHLLQQHHHHNRDLLQAAAAAQPHHLLALTQQLTTGHDTHLDLLAYGNISSSEAQQLWPAVHQQLPAQGLLNPDSWPALGRVLSLGQLGLSDQLSPREGEAGAGDGGAGSGGRAEAAAGAAAVGAAGDAEAAAEAADGEGLSAGAGTLPPSAAAAAAAAAGCGGCPGSGPVCVTYIPDNPNPSNSNHALTYYLQVGPDDITTSVMCDLFVQLASKPAFHTLRTRSRLGYSVSLSSSSLQRQLGLVLRLQSPSTTPADICAVVRAWMAAFRPELEQVLQDKLHSSKQALLDKYLQPAKSLADAAHRAWLPIGSSRTLVFDRRQQKAAVVQQVSQQQVVEWYEQHVHPDGCRHQALCVQVWGGAAGVPDEAVARCEEALGAAAVLDADVEAFKQRQQLLPLPAMQLPPARGTAV